LKNPSATFSTISRVLRTGDLQNTQLDCRDEKYFLAHKLK